MEVSVEVSKFSSASINSDDTPLQNLTVLCIEWVPYQDDTHKSRSVKDFFALLPLKVHLVYQVPGSIDFN